MLRVKKGLCAPLRLSSMLSWPATGTTQMDRISGEDIRLEEWRTGRAENPGKAQARGVVRARKTRPAASTEAMLSP